MTTLSRVFSSTRNYLYIRDHILLWGFYSFSFSTFDGAYIADDDPRPSHHC